MWDLSSPIVHRSFLLPQWNVFETGDVGCMCEPLPDVKGLFQKEPLWFDHEWQGEIYFPLSKCTFGKGGKKKNAKQSGSRYKLHCCSCLKHIDTEVTCTTTQELIESVIVVRDFCLHLLIDQKCWCFDCGFLHSKKQETFPSYTEYEGMWIFADS